MLKRLEQHEFSIEAFKCHWCKSEAPWLGHIVPSAGILPNPDKIKSILQLQFPETVTDLWSFVGMVDFCQSFWKGQADLMAPPTALSGQSKGKLHPTLELILAFDAVEIFIAENVLLAFPDLNVPCNIHTDASDLQSGAVIEQNKNAVAFFSCKLSSVQLKHPTIDKEMLCIVEVLKECQSVPWGAMINVHTDHINLACNAITSNCIMTWCMLCEEFSPVLHCIKGPDNVEACTTLTPPIQRVLANPTNHRH